MTPATPEAPPRAEPALALGWVPAEHAFRLVAPRARRVELVLRRHPDGPDERVVPMQPIQVRDPVLGRQAGVAYWEVIEPYPWRYYRYRVEQFGKVLEVADPRSTAVARQWVVGHPTWSVAEHAPFDWQGDLRPRLDPALAVIVELHVRDFTVHPSAGVQHPGTYLGLTETGPEVRGGLQALRELGATAVELLPIQSYAALEPDQPPPGDPKGWYNVTGRNHWGYMTSYFFAPSERYSLRGAVPQPGAWLGVDPDGTFHDPALEVKEMVRRLHRAGLAVILDIVPNHVSTADHNPIAVLDPGSWLVRNPDGTYRNHSGCGNDLNSADPTIRRLIVDAFVHWLREFHVDGFRIDLGEILDDGCLRDLRDACRAEYGRVLLIAEPWSMAGYRPQPIAELGYHVWDDRFRNGWKGHDPHRERGWLFGEATGATRLEAAQRLAGGTRDVGGPLPLPGVAYLESHDDATLGDFVRRAMGEVVPGQEVLRSHLAKLGPRTLRLHQLAAAVVLLSRGLPMLAQGQEWGRAKVRPVSKGQDGPPDREPWGVLDANSYNRDDSTNWLDWSERALNPELVETYRRLIEVRKAWLVPALMHPGDVRLLGGSRDPALGYLAGTPRGRVAVLLNGGLDDEAWFNLPGGPWWLVYGGDLANIVPIHGGVAVRLGAMSAALAVEGP